MQPVDPLVVAVEPAGPPQVGVDDHTAQVVGGQLAGMTLDADVAEAVRGVPRFEGLAGPAGRDDPVDLAGRQRLGQERHVHAEVIRRHIAVGAQGLAVREGEAGAHRTEVGQPHPAVDVLAEVEDLPVGTRAGHRDRDEFLDAPHGRGG